jgi:Ca-activated chloride channel family protein
LSASGGTDINRALLDTLAGVDPERPTILIFLTDGQPTEGEVEVDRILTNFAGNTHPNVRLFAFGVGDDVNTILLDTLAQEQRGASAYVRPGERIDEEVSAFYAKVSTPLLADIDVRVDSVHVEEIYPYPLPDLFAGTQLVIVGRYREGGPALIQLNGTVNDQEEQFIYEGTFKDAGGDGFIPRLWATRKIGYLLNQIRLHGESQELVDEIVELSIRYGIVTPYTSYLVQEDADILTREGRQELSSRAFDAIAAEPTMAAGAEAVAEAEAKASIQRADRAAAPAPGAAEVVKIVGARTFVYQDGVWTDTTYDPSRSDVQTVGFGSDAYFDLLATRPDLGDFFALGKQVIVVVDGMAYEVSPSGADTVELPPTPTSVKPEQPSVTPTARSVAANATPIPASGGDADEGGTVFGLCPSALVLLGLGLTPIVGLLLLRRKRQ